MISDHTAGRRVLWLILASTAARAVVAGLLELGNDEVYYRTYALYPDLSHFDHPPMVGWIIQLFTLNLYFDNGFFIRLPSLLLGALNIWLVYQAGKRFRDALTGWYAALLFTASLYGSVICGVFILPDTPQLTFWLTAVLLLGTALPEGPSGGSARHVVFAGLAIGLAMLSKYTAVMLWVGAMAYVLAYRRTWLRSPVLYLSMLISAVFFIPVLAWNIQHDLVSFSFHGSRVGIFQGGWHPDKFLTELGGEILYSNPVNFVLLMISLWVIVRRRDTFLRPGILPLLLLWSVPLIAIFLGVSLFRSTLPHWTGPAYTTLVFLPAAWLAGAEKSRPEQRLFPTPVAAALALLMLIALAGVVQVRTGLFYSGKETDPRKRGEQDVSMDMYGWSQIGSAFASIATRDVMNGAMPPAAPIFSHRWFPAANLDHYVAGPAGTFVLAIGPLRKIHKYHWINEARGGFREGMDGYYITTSRDYADPLTNIGQYFGQIIPCDTVPLVRCGKVAGYAFIYQVRDMTRVP
jgi:hypothetical protein